MRMRREDIAFSFGVTELQIPVRYPSKVTLSLYELSAQK